MLTVCTWLWGNKYSDVYVNRLHDGVKRHLKQPHRFRVFEPPAQDHHLTSIKGCFARLRMFDPLFQVLHNLHQGDRVLVLDLDNIITGPLDPLVDRTEPFVIFQGANAANPCPYNGSAWMLRVGHRPDVWTDFSVEKAKQTKFYEFPDDQGWFWHKMPDAAGWKAGAESGVYGFQKPGWPGGKANTELPPGARMVAFFGSRDPSQFTDLKWVKTHWIGARK